MEEIIRSSLVAGIPLLLAALGGIISERAGVLNIALEGMMLIGAFTVAWAGSSTNDLGGVLATIGIAVAVGFVLAWVMVVLRGDQVVVGIALNIFALGVTGYLFTVVSGDSVGGTLRTSSHHSFGIPGLQEIPWVGQFFNVHWLGYITFLLVPATYYALWRTGLGVRLRACGEYAEGARATGLSVVRVRVLATVVSCVLAALAGAYLVVGDVGVFRQNMTSGRGYIALAVVILGRWHPAGALGAAAMFAVAQALVFYLQAQGVGIPAEVVLAMPYIVGLIAITVFGRRVRPPAEDGRPLHLAT